MTILIAVASRHGSTYAIGEAIAAELGRLGHAATVRNADEVCAITGYAAVVIGSAVYMGRWLPAAWDVAHREGITDVPVWLFSSGPLGQDDPQPHAPPQHIDELAIAIGAGGHRAFVGTLDAGALGFAERLVANLVHAPSGDFRDWAAIRAWAQEIAGSLPASGVQPADGDTGGAALQAARGSR